MVCLFISFDFFSKLCSNYMYLSAGKGPLGNFVWVGGGGGWVFGAQSLSLLEVWTKNLMILHFIA